MIWLILAVLTLGTLLYLCEPLYRSSAPAVVQEDIGAYRAEVEQVSADESLNIKRQLLQRAKVNTVRTAVPRAWLAVVFVASFFLSVFMYHSLGSPQLATSDVPRVEPQPFSASGQDAIAQMSREDREAMINAMVEGLAARLKEEPDDVEGWVRLLRSRLVLQQDANEDLALMRQTFEGQPEVISDIIARSSRPPQSE